MHEESPIDLFAFIIGVLLGVPIYSLVSYIVLVQWQKSVTDPSDRARNTNDNKDG
jgi:hypothetical protein